MKFSTALCFLYLFITLAWLGTNRSAGLHKHHVKQLLNQGGFSGKEQQGNRAVDKDVNNLNHETKKEENNGMDDVKSWKTNQNNSHLQTNNGGNRIPCEGNSCLWSKTNVFSTFKNKKNLSAKLTRHRRRESVYLAKALDMLDHAIPRESGNFATRATSNKPFKQISTGTNTSKENISNTTLVNKPVKTQPGDKRQQWFDDSTSEMRPRFFFNSAPAEYVDQKPPSLRRTEHGAIHLALPAMAGGGPHVPEHFHGIGPFFKGVNNGDHIRKHHTHFPPFPLVLVGNPASHHISVAPHFHNHPHQHHFGPPPYAIHINAPPRLGSPPPPPPPNLLPQTLPPFPDPPAIPQTLPPFPDSNAIPPGMLGEPMPPLNSQLGVEPPPPPPPNVNMMPPPDVPIQLHPPMGAPNGAETMPPDLHMLPPEGIPMQPPPIDLQGMPPPDELSPMGPPYPPLGIEPPPPDIHMLPPPDIPVHPEHPIYGPTGAETDFHMTPPEGIPMSPPTDFQGMPPPEEVPYMSPPHDVQSVPFPVPVPSPPKIEHVPYPVPVPGPPSIQTVMVPVRVPSPTKIQQVAVPVESPPKIQNIPIPYPVAVPSPPRIKHVPYPVAFPVKEPGEIQKIYYPIGVPQPSQIRHVPYPVYIRYPAEIRRIPYAVASPPKPYPVPVPSPPHLVIHRVPYPVMFPQKVPYPIPIVVQHHHIHEDMNNGGGEDNLFFHLCDIRI